MLASAYPKSIVYAITATLLLLAGTAHSSHCDETIRPDEGSLGYKWRPGSEVCEGLYRAKVSARLQVVSFLNDSLSFDPDIDSDLYVSVPASVRKMNREMSIRAVALDSGTYYRLDALLPENRVLHWPLENVVLPSGFKATDLGLYGWTGEGISRVFIPLDIGNSETAEAVTEKPFELKVRSPIDLDIIRWRTWIEGSEILQDEVKQDRFRGGRPFSVFINRGPAAIVNLEIRVKESNSDNWLPVRLQVFRTP